jgi:phosphatidylglycerol lysyltransferase
MEATNAISLIALVICLLALAETRSQTHVLSNNAWWAVVLSPDMPHSLRVAVAVSVLVALTAIWQLLRPGHVRALPWDGAARQRFRGLGAVPPTVEPDGLVMGENDRAGIPVRRVGRVLLGLGDPVGAEADRISAIWRLRDLARQEGLDPAVWRAGPGFLTVYGDLGLTALPLGPDGLPLPETANETPTVDQYLVCVAERDLNLLLPLLPELAGQKSVAVAA